MSADGVLLFGRYAFAPNRLGYCGPEDNQALLEYVAAKNPDRGLVELAKRFEGAYPYLHLIAQANRIADPFDLRVVEAYWIGNRLLDTVQPAAFHESLDSRFRARMTASEFGWLARKVELAARPHHSFHVFDVYVRAGLMRDERAGIALETMDACRVSWGRVSLVEPADLVVERPRLELTCGKLTLSEPCTMRVSRQLDGKGFIDQVQVGDVVSIHWRWACEVLSPAALARLNMASRRSMELANLTF